MLIGSFLDFKMMKDFRKYFWFSGCLSVILISTGFPLHAIWGMLFLIFCVLMGILEVLVEK